MRFKVTNAHNDDLGLIELETLEDLIEFQIKKDDPIIITAQVDGLNQIRIYDNYLE